MIESTDQSEIPELPETGAAQRQHSLETTRWLHK